MRWFVRRRPRSGGRVVELLCRAEGIQLNLQDNQVVILTVDGLHVVGDWVGD